MFVLALPLVLLPAASLYAFQTTVELPQQPYLPLAMAVQAASAAVAQCEEDGYRVSVAVVDRGGVLKVLLRADGTGPHTVSSSTRKAYTSASLGRSTAELAKTVAENPAVEGLRNMDPQILILAGGLPIVVNESVVGGIGVGGAPGGNLDEACAQAGIDAVLAEGGATEDATAPTPTPKP
ncbi:MAG: heme-binding protein [Caldilinea sp. CFX5]|nr:heme-binding protein [Caldilinea sp. CFX5]